MQETITIIVTAAQGSRLCQLAKAIDMAPEDYCAMVLAFHLARKADIDAGRKDGDL